MVKKSGRIYFFWIGGFRDENNLNSFLWTDGTSMTFTNWKPGEPNNYIEKCVMLGWGTSEGWNDYTCEMEGTFVCEK